MSVPTRMQNEEETFHIEIELPGVDKKDITFKMQETSCLHRRTARRRPSWTYAIGCPVDPNRAKATFKNGL